jgi:hypothetical protein
MKKANDTFPMGFERVGKQFALLVHHREPSEKGSEHHADVKQPRENAIS